MGYSTPLIVGDTIYSTRNQQGVTGGGNATLISAFEITTGAIKWTYSGDFAFPSQAAVGGGFVVFHSGMGSSNNDPGQLYVLDAITGVLRYKVALLGTPTSPVSHNVMPLLIPNPADGTVMAYCADPSRLMAVQLGPASGAILWSQGLLFGETTLPTLVGDSIVLQGAAYDLATGTPNRFHSIGGGGSNNVVYDSVRRNIYIWKYDTGGQSLIAYRYTSNAQIDFLWQHFGPGTGWGTVAIGSDGKLYSAGESLLTELDPDTGATLRSVSGTFALGLAPSITAGTIWTNSGTQTMAYNLQTFQLERTFPGSNFVTDYTSSGAFADGYFLLDYGTILESRGFDVYAAPAAHALNLSTRMRVQVGDNVGIGGFIISGSAPKQVLLRGIGPSLSGFGVLDALADPVLELHGPGGFATITNDNWRETQAPAIQASGLAPVNDAESAILVTLNPGPYTAVLKGKNNSEGVALVEAYDLDQAAASKLGNISTRAFVGTGSNVVIAGFILGGNAGYDNIIVRGIGPSLAASGVPNPLADPALELHDSNGALVIANDNWQDNPPQAARISAANLAPTNALESAIAVTVPPGAYTVLLKGMDNGTGVGLVEVYDRGAP